MVPLLTTPLPVPHGFTTRLGGVSEGPFASLNLSAATGDDPKRVEENQRRVLAAFGHPPVAGLKQVHGTEIRLVEGPGVWEGDGLLTRTPGLLLRVGVADCYPLLLYHPEGAVAALHAGWRGVVGGSSPGPWSGWKAWAWIPRGSTWPLAPASGAGATRWERRWQRGLPKRA